MSPSTSSPSRAARARAGLMPRGTTGVRRTGTRRSASTTAAAAPPAPSTTALLPGRGHSRRVLSPISNPAASVLSPTSRPPGVTVIVLTAPVRSASPSRTSQAAASAYLYGMVTLAPRQRPARRSRRRAGSVCGGTSTISYEPSRPLAASAASCMTWLGESAMPSPIRQRRNGSGTSRTARLAEELHDLLLVLLFGDAVVVVTTAIGEVEIVRRARRLCGGRDAARPRIGDRRRGKAGVQVGVVRGVDLQLRRAEC